MSRHVCEADPERTQQELARLEVCVCVRVSGGRGVSLSMSGHEQTQTPVVTNWQVGGEVEGLKLVSTKSHLRKVSSGRGR